MDNLQKLEEITKKISDQENKLFINNDILLVVSEAFARYIRQDDVGVIFTYMLDKILKITKSEYGFIGQVKYKEDGSPYLHTKAITDISWNEETKKLFEENKEKGLKFENMDTLFGYGIIHGTTVISNDPLNDHRSNGTPYGHPPLKSFLGLPFFDKGKIIGQIGLANREGGYTDEFVHSLESFRVACSTIINATIGKDK